MVNVCHVVNNLRIGGAQQLILDIAKNLEPRFRLKVVSLEDDAGPLADELRAIGVEVLVLGAGYGRLSVLSRLPALVRALRGSDIVHSHLFAGNLWARLAGPFAGCRHFVCHEHSTYPQKNRLLGLPILIERMLARYTDRIVCISRAVFAYTLQQSRLPKAKFCLLSNGIEVARFAGSACDRELRRQFCPAGRQLIIAVGTLTAAKDQQTLLQAFALALDGGVNAHLLMVGEGALRKELERQVAALGVSERVHFAGARRDVAQLLACADYFVTSSVREGLGLAAMEALAAGLPVLATEVGGLPEVVTPEVGILVPPRDPVALSGAMVLMSSQVGTGVYHRGSLTALAFERHDIAPYCSALAALYDDILGGSR